MYIYHCARHHFPVSRKHSTLGEAIESAALDIEFATGWPKKITTETGEVVYDEKALWEKAKQLQSV